MKTGSMSCSCAGSVSRSALRWSVCAYMDARSRGPSTGSYRPPSVGRLVLSKSRGLLMAFTEMARISSAERNEKDAAVMQPAIGTLGSIVRAAQPAGVPCPTFFFQGGGGWLPSQVPLTRQKKIGRAPAQSLHRLWPCRRLPLTVPLLPPIIPNPTSDTCPR